MECVKTATGSNLGRCTLISNIEIRDSVWYWWEEQTSKHVSSEFTHWLLEPIWLTDQNPHRSQTTIIRIILNHSFTNTTSTVSRRNHSAQQDASQSLVDQWLSFIPSCAWDTNLIFSMIFHCKYCDELSLMPFLNQ